MDDAARARIDELVATAREAMDRAYAPYSGFQVGAALLAGDRVFTGQNIENASYPVSVCAERNAVGRMIDAGERQIQAVAVVTAADTPTPPCGACRQVLWEFAGDIEVILADLDKIKTTHRLKDLLPHPFDARFIE